MVELDVFFSGYYQLMMVTVVSKKEEINEKKKINSFSITYIIKSTM
jgi:hypothetical protein